MMSASPSPLLEVQADSWCQSEQQAQADEQQTAEAADIVIKCLEEQSAQADGQQTPEAADILSRFAYRIPERQPYPGILATIRRNIFVGFVLLVFLGTGAWLTADAVRVVLWIDADPQANFRWLIEQGKLFSVPLVCLLFTWLTSHPTNATRRNHFSTFLYIFICFS